MHTQNNTNNTESSSSNHQKSHMFFYYAFIAREIHLYVSRWDFKSFRIFNIKYKFDSMVWMLNKMWFPLCETAQGPHKHNKHTKQTVDFICRNCLCAPSGPYKKSCLMFYNSVLLHFVWFFVQTTEWRYWHSIQYSHLICWPCLLGKV